MNNTELLIVHEIIHVLSTLTLKWDHNLGTPKTLRINFEMYMYGWSKCANISNFEIVKI